MVFLKFDQKWFRNVKVFLHAGNGGRKFELFTSLLLSITLTDWANFTKVYPNGHGNLVLYFLVKSMAPLIKGISACTLPCLIVGGGIFLGKLTSPLLIIIASLLTFTKYIRRGNYYDNVANTKHDRKFFSSTMWM